MNSTSRACADALRSLDLIPDTELSTFIVGSTARGWANEYSDVDVVVISAIAFVDDRAVTATVPLTPDSLPVVTFTREGRRWEIKYWLDAQVDQLFEKITWEAFERDRKVGSRLTVTESLFLGRLSTCVSVSGPEWVQRRRRQLEGSAFRSFMVIEMLAEADDAVEDATGQLAAGDIESAVLSAQAAFGYAMDALLAGHGEFGPQPKWRARRFRAASPSLVSFPEYWAIQTMRDYDPTRPQDWVRRVIEICKRVAMEVEV